MSIFKELKKDSRFTSGAYALTLVTALLVLALVVRGPEESGKLVADSSGSIVGINRRSTSGSERYELTLEINDGGSVIQRDITIMLQADGSKSVNASISEDESREAEIESAVNGIISEIEYSKKKKIRFPDKLPDGTPLKWLARRRSTGATAILIPVMYVVLMALLAADSLKGDRSEAEERTAIQKGLPRFCNQLFLMMNAGLILSDAFGIITESYSKYSGTGISSFEKDLAGLKEATCGHRISTASVLSEYAARHDVKELIRIAAILSENEKRGSDVVESLERESRYLWNERKIVAKECGKAIDTKMSYPLGLLLILLITITMAPALLNM